MKTYTYDRPTGVGGVCRYELWFDGSQWRCDYQNPPGTYHSGTEVGATPEIAVGRFCVQAREALIAMVRS